MTASNLQESNKYYIPPINNLYYLGIGLTNRCNFDCPICYYHRENYKSRQYTDLTLDKLNTIFSNLPRLKNVIVGLEGEPFCHPQIFEALNIIDRHAENISLVTNGSLLNHNIINKLLDFSISSIILNVDASDPENYSKFRKNGNFHKLLKVTDELINLYCEKVVFHCVLFKENLKTALRLPIIADKLGIKYISMQTIQYFKELSSRGISNLCSNDLLYAIEKLSENASIHNVKIIFDCTNISNTTINNILDKKNSDIVLVNTDKEKCERIYKYTSLLSNGTLFPCCGNFKPELVSEYNFDGIFNHNKILGIRKRWASNNISKTCKLCLGYDNHQVC